MTCHQSERKQISKKHAKMWHLSGRVVPVWMWTPPRSLEGALVAEAVERSTKLLGAAAGQEGATYANFGQKRDHTSHAGIRCTAIENAAFIESCNGSFRSG